MNITLANLESFQEAIKQASKVLRCSNANERLELADKMRKGVTCDFFQLELDDDDDDDDNNEEQQQQQDDDDETEDNHRTNMEENRNRKQFYIATCFFVIVFLLIAIQNDQDFIQSMIIQGRRKRKFDDEENLPRSKVRRITVKNEPEQVDNRNLDKRNVRSNFPSSQCSIHLHRFSFNIRPNIRLSCVRISFVTVFLPRKKHSS